MSELADDRAAYAEDERLDATALAAATQLLEACQEMGFGSCEPLTDAADYLERAAESLGVRRVLRPRSPRKRMPEAVSRNVWDRDDWTCRRCGSHMQLTVDHVIPLSKGGTDDFDNLQTLCWSCNSSKGAR